MTKYLTAAIPMYAMAIALGLSVGEVSRAVQGQTDDAVVAIVNGRRITQKEVDISVVSKVLPLEEQIYALRKTALENLVLRAVLEDEAKKRGVSIEELRKQLTAEKVEVLATQVEEVYSDNASVFESMSPDEAKERLRLDLENQTRMRNYRAALLRLKETSKIELRLKEPRLPSVPDNGTAPSTGSKEAAITITEFSDFQCPYCREAQGAIKQVLANYGNNVRVIFKHLPLDIHAQAFGSAQAAFCAGDQGFFWQYHDALFASEVLSTEVFNKMASNLGLDISKFKACLVSEASRTAVFKDIQEARQLGINSTPTFIVNGKLVRGVISSEELKGIIERELKSSQITFHTKLP